MECQSTAVNYLIWIIRIYKIPFGHKGLTSFLRNIHKNARLLHWKNNWKLVSLQVV